MTLKQDKAVSRRTFLKTAGAGAALAALPVMQSKAQATTFSWRMVTSWGAGTPILQTGAERFADLVRERTNGDLDIEVFAGGELVPAASGEFDAVSSGTVQASNSASYYWAGQVPAAQFFTAVPFGFTFDQLQAFLLGGGGLELWEEVYDPFGLVPVPLITTSMQMGGWFNTKIESIDDLNGLKMRIPGLGGAVMAKAGVNTILLPGSEIFTALQTGTIDATEFVGPFIDKILGFAEVAKYYYHPGWHEPGVTAEFMMNKDAWNALPKDIQGIIRGSAADTTAWSFAQFEAENSKALIALQEEFPDMELVRFPDEVLAELRRLTDVVLDEQGDGDAVFTKVRDAVVKFADLVGGWSDVSIESYLPAIQ